MISYSIQTLHPKKLVGKHLTTTMANNRTAELWKSFMPQRKAIPNSVDPDLISMQVFPVGFSFQNFDVHAPFEKWAAIEVSNYLQIPDGMESFDLPGGLYAVFLHKGPASEGERTFRYIFREWLPQSGYALDNRPHFEVLGAKYKNNEPDSEEEIWIPVKPAL